MKRRQLFLRTPGAVSWCWFPCRLRLLRLRADPHAVGPAGDPSPTTVLDGHNAAYECIIETTERLLGHLMSEPVFIFNVYLFWTKRSQLGDSGYTRCIEVWPGSSVPVESRGC